MVEWLHPLLGADGMRAVDAWAIEDRGIPALELMETAGGAVATAVAETAEAGPVRIVCGKGNNGGDGLVAARHLEQTGYEVDVLLLWPADELSEDSAANLARLSGSAREVDEGDLSESLAGSGAVVDAIFGTGFSDAPREPALSAIEAMNGCGARVIACDIASGVDASTGEAAGSSVDADLTVTFHSAKVGHLISPGKERTGELRVAPIGIPEGGPAEPSAGVIDAGVLSLAPARAAGSTKFSSGQVVIAGGSRGLTGAVCMSAAAAIRSGAGYATVAVPSDLEQIFEVKLTEVMSKGCGGADAHLDETSLDAVLAAYDGAAAGVLGPGLGRDDSSLALARDVASRVEAPLLIDADGLGAFNEELGVLRERFEPTVLTPHAGELGRLLGRPSAEIGDHRLECAKAAAAESGAIVVLKGDDTIVTDGERVAINAVSAPALATAGTGDVLSGMTGALLARGMEPFAAACAAVIAHTRAGRAAARRIGAPESVTATDVIDSIPAGLSLDREVL